MYHIGTERPGGGNGRSGIFAPSSHLLVLGAPHIFFYLFLFHGTLDLCLGSISSELGLCL